MAEITRRKFMGGGALLIGSAALGIPAGEALLPSPVQAAEVRFPESSCGQEGVDRKSILVAYASMSGTTGEVAEAIGRSLCGPNTTVDIRRIGSVTDIEPYDAFVIGSAIRGANWLPQARRFVEDHKMNLSSKPTAYFLTCLTLAHPGPGPRQKARDMLEPILNEIPEVKPVGLGLFAGVLDYSRLKATVRMVMRYKMGSKGVKEGDYRNWEEIAAWSQAFKPTLIPPPKARAKTV